MCRKEAKGSRLWLRLIEIGSNKKLKERQKKLLDEAYELTKVFGSMIEKTGDIYYLKLYFILSLVIRV
ncbi:MAG: hypothetical protein ACC618_03905 [Patescibacteria group bacterium]